MYAEAIRRVAVVGSGPMESGITIQFAIGDYDVQLGDVSNERLELAVNTMATNLELMRDLGVKSDKGFYKWEDEQMAAIRQKVGKALAEIGQFPD